MTWVILNPTSGSYDESAVNQLLAGLEVAGYPPLRVVRVPEEPAPTRATLEQAHVELLVVFTGDGTANRALTPLYGWQGKILALPGGTQNLLACALHGERSMVEIVAHLNLGGLRTVRRPLIRCSAGDALCEIVAGPGAAWSGVRESLREGDVADLASSAREAIEKSVGGTMVTVVDPPGGKAEGYPAIRLYSCGAAGMAVDGYGAATVLDYARQGMAMLLRNFRDGPHDELGVHRSVTCRSSEPIELMLDGEPATGNPEEHFQLSDCDLTFLANGEGYA